MNVDLVFAMIFAVIVMAFVLVLGGDQISGFFCLSGDAQAASAVRDLQTEADNLYVLASGSSRDFEVRIPGDALLCVLDPDNPAPDVSRGWDPPESVQLILSTPDFAESRNNIWYKSCGSWQSLSAPRLRADRSFCVSGADSILLTNAGTSVTAEP